jgi:hypothetical protein
MLARGLKIREDPIVWRPGHLVDAGRKFGQLTVRVRARGKARGPAVNRQNSLCPYLPDSVRRVAIGEVESAVGPVAHRGVVGSLAGNLARSGFLGRR